MSDTPRVVALVAAAPDVDATRRAAILPAAQARVVAGRDILLATCHRVEVFRSADAEAIDIDGARRLEGTAAADHVIRLALGLESAVIGEDQVLHQLRLALTEGRRVRPIGGDLGLLVDRALSAGRTGRSWRPAMVTSLAERAFDLATERIGPLDGRRVLVVGAGAMGRSAADAARRGGARVSLASRDPGHASEVAGRLGVDTVDLDPGASAIRDVDLVVIALAGAWLIGPTTRAALIDRPLVIDLSMPPAIDAATRSALGPRGVDIDGLGVDVATNPVLERYRARLERLAGQTLEGYLATVAERRRSRAQRLADRIERERADALAAWLRQRPALDGVAVEALDDLSRAVSARLFREPLARLAQDPTAGARALSTSCSTRERDHRHRRADDPGRDQGQCPGPGPGPARDRRPGGHRRDRRVHDDRSPTATSGRPTRRGARVPSSPPSNRPSWRAGWTWPSTAPRTSRPTSRPVCASVPSCRGPRPTTSWSCRPASPPRTWPGCRPERAWARTARDGRPSSGLFGRTCTSIPSTATSTRGCAGSTAARPMPWCSPRPG